ncbi:MAG TPA: TldD/PmbA family protein, partial [Candidatus Polarisedimenticolia bacterium]|nr:TldD/PmbA family protein [Candidatus Polarisedimenticolia bacterium]
MGRTRREFLATCGAGATLWAASRLVPGGILISRVEADEISPDALRDLAAFALDRAKKAGATYADIRINRYRTQAVGMRSQPDFATGALNHVPSINETESFGFGLRVIAAGAWGFAGRHVVTKDAIAAAAKEAVAIARADAPLRREPVRLAKVAAFNASWRTPVKQDPFAVTVKDKLEFLRGLNGEIKKVEGVFSANGTIALRRESRFFASSEGSRIEQEVVHTASELTATAVEKGRKTKTRTYRPHAVAAGWEQVERARYADHARRLGEEAVAHLKAPSVEPGAKDLVLMPSHLGLTIHESLGHSTELDRALGYEADLAGTTFLTTDKLGKLRVGSDLVNVNGDRVRPESLSTCGWDDDGVKTRQFPLFKQGIFVGYQTIRDQAHLIGQEESTGCCYADSYASVPFQRMPNVWLVPSAQPITLAQLIAGVDDGVLIDGRGSYSIDQQRYNFQFGGDAFWEIKHGKLGGQLADVAYQSRTPDFWQACDGLGGQDTWQNVGLNADGKGQPSQLNAMSHGCPPARFR